MCEWLPSLLAITVANNFLSNLIWLWGPTKNVPVPSRVWIFGESRVFSYVCAWTAWIFHQCTVYMSICAFATVCTWFFWVEYQRTLHTFVSCNLLVWSKPLWIELAWNAYWKAQPKLWWILKNVEKTCTVKKCIVNRMFQSMQFLNAFFLLLANVHGCMWRVSTGVRQIPSYDSYQLSPTNVGPSLLWLICHSGGWFFNHSLIKSIIASFVPGRAVIALMRCAPTLNATIGHWMKKGLRLSAVAGLPAACWAIRFFLVFKWGHTWLPNSEFEAKYMKSTEIISAKALWFMRFYDPSRSYCICLEKFGTSHEWKLGMVAVGFDDWWWKSGD